MASSLLQSFEDHTSNCLRSQVEAVSLSFCKQLSLMKSCCCTGIADRQLFRFHDDVQPERSHQD